MAGPGEGQEEGGCSALLGLTDQGRASCRGKPSDQCELNTPTLPEASSNLWTCQDSSPG